MVALLVGLIFILFAVYSILPFPWALNWWEEVLLVLQGAIPLIALFIGMIALFIGIADIKDRQEAKREEAEEKKSEST